MGMSVSQLGVILSLKEHINDKNVLSLGVQFPPSKNEIITFQKNFPELLSNSELDILSQASLKDFQKVLFKNILGAKDIHSIDISSEEGADYIWNMNEDLSINNEDRSLVKLSSSFDFVFEGGTMEHVSNTGSYLKNVFFLLKTKGIYCLNIPSSGSLEHGFFQFSPTFFADLTSTNSPNITLDYLCIDDGQLKLRGLAFNSFYKRINFDFPPKLAISKSHRFYKKSYQSTSLATGTLICLLNNSSVPLDIMAVIQKNQDFSLNMNLI
ncbi:uncharacterized protein METZ01_LOCUS396278, partial [marine metagenome]